MKAGLEALWGGLWESLDSSHLSFLLSLASFPKASTTPQYSNLKTKETRRTSTKLYFFCHLSRMKTPLWFSQNYTNVKASGSHAHLPITLIISEFSLKCYLLQPLVMEAKAFFLPPTHFGTCQLRSALWARLFQPKTGLWSVDSEWNGKHCWMTTLVTWYLMQSTSWKNKYVQFLQARGRLRGWDHVEEKPHQDEDLLGQCLVDILASLGKSSSDA